MSTRLSRKSKGGSRVVSMLNEKKRKAGNDNLGDFLLPILLLPTSLLFILFMIRVTDDTITSLSSTSIANPPSITATPSPPPLPLPEPSSPCTLPPPRSAKPNKRQLNPRILLNFAKHTLQDYTERGLPPPPSCLRDLEKYSQRVRDHEFPADTNPISPNMNNNNNNSNNNNNNDDDNRSSSSSLSSSNSLSSVSSSSFPLLSGISTQPPVHLPPLPLYSKPTGPPCAFFPISTNSVIMDQTALLGNKLISNKRSRSDSNNNSNNDNNDHNNNKSTDNKVVDSAEKEDQATLLSNDSSKISPTDGDDDSELEEDASVQSAADPNTARTLRMIYAAANNKPYSSSKDNNPSQKELNEAISIVQKTIMLGVNQVPDQVLIKKHTNESIKCLLGYTFLYIVINCCNLLTQRYVDNGISAEVKWYEEGEPAVGDESGGEKKDIPNAKKTKRGGNKSASMAISMTNGKPSDVHTLDMKSLIIGLLKEDYRKAIIQMIPPDHEQGKLIDDALCDDVVRNLQTSWKRGGIRSLMSIIRQLHFNFFKMVWTNVSGSKSSQAKLKKLFTDTIKKERNETDYYRGMRLKKEKPINWRDKVTEFKNNYPINLEPLVVGQDNTQFAASSSSSPYTDIDTTSPFPSPMLPSPLITGACNSGSSTPLDSYSTALFSSPSHNPLATPKVGKVGQSRPPLNPSPVSPLLPPPAIRLGSSYFVIAEQEIVVPLQSEKCPYLWIQLHCPFLPLHTSEAIVNQFLDAITDYVGNLNDVPFTLIIPRHQKASPIFAKCDVENCESKSFRLVPDDADNADAISIQSQLNDFAKSTVKKIRHNPFGDTIPEERLTIQTLPKPWEFDLDSPGSVLYWINSQNGIVFAVKLKQPQTRKRVFGKVGTSLGNASVTPMAAAIDNSTVVWQNHYEPPLPPPTRDSEQLQHCCVCGFDWRSYIKHNNNADKSEWSYLGCKTDQCNRWLCKPCIKWKECTFGETVKAPSDMYCPFCMFCHAINCKGPHNSAVSVSKSRALYAADPAGEWGRYGQCKRCMVVYHWQCAAENNKCRYCNDVINIIEQ